MVSTDGIIAEALERPIKKHLGIILSSSPYSLKIGRCGK